jgi:hypothetical protein
MAVTILGITLGGEAARKREIANVYASKYPLSGDVAQVRETLAKATIELTDLKNQKPKKAADKRIRQRNVTALSAWVMQLQNTIKDAQSGMGTTKNNFTFAPPTAETLLGKNAYNKPITTTSGTTKKVQEKPISAKEIVETSKVVDTIDGGQPQMGAQGDYPPPQGVQGTNYGKWIGLGALGLGVITLGYYLVNRKK